MTLWCPAQSSPNVGGGGGLQQNGVASGTPGCTLDSSLWYSIYRRSTSFVGYLVWLAVLALLWVCVFCVAAGPVIFLRLDLWPPLRACLPLSGPCVGADAAPVPHVVRLQAARVKEGVLVAALSALRLAYLAMLVAIAFQTRAPTFACVEFSFNRQVRRYVASPLYHMAVISYRRYIASPFAPFFTSLLLPLHTHLLLLFASFFPHSISTGPGCHLRHRR